MGVTSREFTSGQKVFGRYTLVKVLGRGGMGIVWLARDEELERNVALKFVPDLMIQDRAAFDQLKRETKRCLELTHPHIVRIHDFVHDERSGCISMEYVDGETLSNLRVEKEKKVFESDEIAAWISQLCDALDYAHNHAKIIHCDLKPANLMMNQRGDLKVSDFGIARSLGDSVSRLTMEQGRSGTLVYMSPQQLGGQRCTHLDDIYSLGATVYELLTSKPPFYSGNIDRQICERVAPSMTARRKELDIEPALVPKVWEDAVAACLAKNPSHRPQSVAEIAQRLQPMPGQTRTRRVLSSNSNKKVLLASGIAALSLLALAGLYLGVLKPQTKPVSPEEAVPEKSIAVLPFLNLSPSKDQEYFSDGITEQITTSLAEIHGFFVVARTSAFAFKNKIEDVREIGRKLHVQHVLEGSVSRNLGKMRVAVQLINTSDGYHTWSKTYDSDEADILSLQGDVAQKVASALRVELHVSETKRLQGAVASNPEAYDLYLRGRYWLNKRTIDSIQKGRALFEEAVAKDPQFALGHAGIADAYILLGEYGAISSVEASKKAWPEVSSALEIDNDLAEAHCSRAQLLSGFEWNWRDGGTEFRKAIELNANSAKAHHWYAFHLSQLGRPDDALREITAAQKQDPLSPIIYAAKGQILWMAHRNDEAIEECRKALDLEPTFAPAFFIMAHAYTDARQSLKAIDAAKKYVEITGNNPPDLVLAYVYAAAGNKDESERIVHQQTARAAGYSFYDLATVYAAWHNTADALQSLERAIDERALEIAWIRVDPRIDSLRTEPRFHRLAGRIISEH
jgi:serine/threonine protein kinase/Tfp pilus assembly protein PilF